MLESFNMELYRNSFCESLSTIHATGSPFVCNVIDLCVGMNLSELGILSKGTPYAYESTN